MKRIMTAIHLNILITFIYLMCMCIFTVTHIRHGAVRGEVRGLVGVSSKEARLGGKHLHPLSHCAGLGHIFNHSPPHFKCPILQLVAARD